MADPSSMHPHLPLLHPILSSWETISNSFIHNWPNKQNWKCRPGSSSCGKLQISSIPVAAEEPRNKSPLHWGPGPTVGYITLLSHQADEKSHNSVTKELQVTQKGEQRTFHLRAWLMEALKECPLCRPWQNSLGPSVFTDRSLSPARWGNGPLTRVQLHLPHLILWLCCLPWDYSLKRR